MDIFSGCELIIVILVRNKVLLNLKRMLTAMKFTSLPLSFSTTEQYLRLHLVYKKTCSQTLA